MDAVYLAAIAGLWTVLILLTFGFNSLEKTSAARS